MKSKRVFGAIKDVVEGDLFINRLDLSTAKVHRPIRLGVSGSEHEGADSIVLSGGYEDDEDFGDVIIYTGQGGRSNESKAQMVHQTLTGANKGLTISCEKQLPVRVIRGIDKELASSCGKQYRYDGLYVVTSYWQATGKSGFIIWRFRLEKIDRDSDQAVASNKTLNQEPDLDYPEL